MFRFKSRQISHYKKIKQIQNYSMCYDKTVFVWLCVAPNKHNMANLVSLSTAQWLPNFFTILSCTLAPQCGFLIFF